MVELLGGQLQVNLSSSSARRVEPSSAGCPRAWLSQTGSDHLVSPAPERSNKNDVQEVNAWPYKELAKIMERKGSNP